MNSYERTCCYCGKVFVTEHFAQVHHQPGVEHYNPAYGWRAYCKMAHYTADVIGRLKAIFK